MTQVFPLYGLSTPPLGQPSSLPTAAAADPSGELPEEIETVRGRVQLRRQRGDAGVSAGVEHLHVGGERAGFTLLPTRGMGIWKAWAGERSFGWNSPVQGPVHPAWVPLSEPSGLGWLSGFDELLVRCGLESNGAPQFGSGGQLEYPLHGRIANLPAESLSVAVDAEAGTVEVRGTVRESRLFFTNLSLESTIRMAIDGETIEIEDRVTNHSDSPATAQLLYHINLGAPLLSEGATLVAPAVEVVPKTDQAAAAIDSYPRYQGPQVGFAEEVYLMRLVADHSGWTRALLRGADGTAGFGVSFDTSTLPYFIQWKNTAGLADGYVTGLEPATGFPNTRRFEEANGRIVSLEAGETQTHRLRLHLLSSAEQVEAFEAEVRKLALADPKIDRRPRDGWCEG
ncbi:aldose 1-epimerase family protein [Candidatus Laterigemmans baculatus]|uniref:aldose 1-epimerase family protein n=1 Tax=Candidatus Laterigemmans baculatus TaxID=2770505 RepID=UPI0013DA4C3F|nr:aldose 1-epimerase family protein [Candidatus Laterigemmans baculatus]